MPTRLERWIRSKLAATTAFTPRSLVPFAAQSREEPVPYSCPAKIMSGLFVSAYFIAASKIDICSPVDRKSTRLNSSHEWISYAVFCLKKKRQHYRRD